MGRKMKGLVMRDSSDLQVALEAVCNDPYILFRDDLMNANADIKKEPETLL